MKVKRKWPLLILLFVALVTVLIESQGLIINVTPSVKTGLYLKQSGVINRGDIVVFCLNNHDQQIGLTHHYLHVGSVCNGSDPLIKQVIAIPGDEVVLTEDTITVNQKPYFYKTHHYDSFKQPLVMYPRGVFKNTPGYWLAGNHNTYSWDSRYWGPISEKQILHKLKPLLIW